MTRRLRALPVLLVIAAVAATGCGPHSTLSLGVKEQPADLAYGKPVAASSVVSQLIGKLGAPPSLSVPLAQLLGPRATVPAPKIPPQLFGPPPCPPVGTPPRPGLPLTPTVQNIPKSTAVGVYHYHRSGNDVYNGKKTVLSTHIDRVVVVLPGPDPVDGHPVAYQVIYEQDAPRTSLLIFELDNKGDQKNGVDVPSSQGIELVGMILADTRNFKHPIVYAPAVGTRIMTLPVAPESAAVQEPPGVSNGDGFGLPFKIPPSIPPQIDPKWQEDAKATVLDGLQQTPATSGPTHQTIHKDKILACGVVISDWYVNFAAVIRVNGQSITTLNWNSTFGISPQYGGMIVSEQTTISGYRDGVPGPNFAGVTYSLDYKMMIDSLTPTFFAGVVAPTTG